MNILKKQIDLKPLAHAFEKIFLYDLENIINKIYVTQLHFLVKIKTIKNWIW